MSKGHFGISSQFRVQGVHKSVYNFVNASYLWTNIAQLEIILQPCSSSTHYVHSEVMKNCTKIDTETKTWSIPKTDRAQI
jgi:hypothetical protein